MAWIELLFGEEIHWLVYKRVKQLSITEHFFCFVFHPCYCSASIPGFTLAVRTPSRGRHSASIVQRPKRFIRLMNLHSKEKIYPNLHTKIARSGSLSRLLHREQYCWNSLAFSIIQIDNKVTVWHKPTLKLTPGLSTPLSLKQ